MSATAPPAPAVQPISEVRWRTWVRVRGRVRDLRVRPTDGGVSSLECTLVDDTGGITLVFLGRRRISGITLGQEMEVEGMIAENRMRLVMLNPLYTLIGA
jgi:hypothetical protein